VLGGARAKALLAVICRHASEVVLVVQNLPRASSFEELEGVIPHGFKGKVSRSSIEKIFPSKDKCTLNHTSEVLIVTGSIYLIGNVMERIQYSQPVDQSMLQDW
ncbi:MAG: bifunctional folylpolyglutamate synthase/dihydrofolate synthase, partial [Opitutaceae bacterium]|nr:bifunctional folylpolyglutamate synthase/dihydrofolate synthase [Opitutaceae bacterium]